MGNPVTPPDDLLVAAERVVGPWLRRLAIGTAEQAGMGDVLSAEPGRLALDEMVEQVGAETLRQLQDLLATDVDRQPTNPLSLFRMATEPVTELLQRCGVPPVARDRYLQEAFPADQYNLVPSRWDDIDPEMAPVGSAWSAWKAMTILQRRRAEGLR